MPGGVREGGCEASPYSILGIGFALPTGSFGGGLFNQALFQIPKMQQINPGNSLLKE
jgi:hypothetical protein